MRHQHKGSTGTRRSNARSGAHARGRGLLLTIGVLLAACSGGTPSPSGTTGGGAGGGDAGGPSCTGTPVPCEARTGLDCAKELGCSDHGACIGEAMTCDLFKQEGPCTLHFGCTWRTGETTCTGGPKCGAFNDKTTCLMEPGCAWTTSKTGCEGSTDGCTEFSDELLCASQMGCGWQAEACGGSPPIPCETFASLSGCEEQPGCAWK